MGHKVNPKLMRLGYIKTWNSRWFSDKDFPALLRSDVMLRRFLMKKLKEALISRVEIERGVGKLVINVFVGKPGLVIGKGGAGIEELKKELMAKILNKQKLKGKLNVALNILEIDNPNLHSQIVLDSMIKDIELRMPFRRVMKQSIGKVMKAGALGVKTVISGRLNGAEIARTEMLTEGRLPLHTLRADIDYSRGAAWTTYGLIGIKVWIYKGDIFTKNSAIAPKDKLKQETHSTELK